MGGSARALILESVVMTAFAVAGIALYSAPSEMR